MRKLFVFVLFVCSIAASASAQYIASATNDSATTLKTGMPVGVGTGVTPYIESALRLGFPASCIASPGRCNQLAFGDNNGQYWGLRLDSNFDLHFDRNYSGWADGVTFKRSGEVIFPGDVNLTNAHVGIRGNRYLDTSLVLAPPYGVTPDLCASNLDRGAGRCLEISFGLPVSGGQVAQSWGFRLDSQRHLHLDYYPDSGVWTDGIRFGRDGIVTIGSNPGDTAERLHVNGKITATSVIGSVYQDVAEWVPATDDLAPGTVVSVDAASSNTVTPSKRAYDTSVAGVVSAQPGLILGVESASKEMIATTGRVKVRVDASAGAIHLGDLLVTSGRPGVAMRSEPVDIGGVKIHRPGTLIGKALEPLEKGEGEILVLLALQ